ncbi:MAG: protein kinase family protein [Oligoflexia bacterium]|nr:protein kinase family protein [Oligoflexia bacterium]
MNNKNIFLLSLSLTLPLSLYAADPSELINSYPCNAGTEKEIAGMGSFCFSKLLPGLKDHQELIAYRKVEEGGVIKYYPRLLYLSQSQGQWRVAPYVLDGKYNKHFPGETKGAYATETLLSNVFEAALPSYAKDCVKDCKAVAAVNFQARGGLDAAGKDPIYHAATECCLGERKKIPVRCDYSCTNANPAIISGGPLDTYNCFAPISAGIISNPRCAGENVVKAFENVSCRSNNRFIPDFKNWGGQSYEMDHKMLGKGKVYIFEGELNGQKVEWHMAVTDRKNALGEKPMWIQNIKIKDAPPTLAGVDSTNINAGFLLTKPMEYGSQIEGIPPENLGLLQAVGRKTPKETLAIESGSYYDITPLIAKMCPIKEFKKFLEAQVQWKAGPVNADDVLEADVPCSISLENILPSEVAGKDFKRLDQFLDKRKPVKNAEEILKEECVEKAFTSLGIKEPDKSSSAFKEKFRKILSVFNAETISKRQAAMGDGYAAASSIAYKNFKESGIPFAVSIFKDQAYIIKKRAAEESAPAGSTKTMERGVSFQDLLNCNQAAEANATTVKTYAILSPLYTNLFKPHITATAIKKEMAVYSELAALPGPQRKGLVLNKNQGLFTDNGILGKKTSAMFVSELYAKGELGDVLGDASIDWFATAEKQKEFECLYGDVIDGLANLHQAGHAHRDLKDGNVFVDKNSCAGIGDFGEAVKAGDVRIKEARGSALLRHPNLSQPPFTFEQLKKGDIYSLKMMILNNLLSKKRLAASVADEIIRTHGRCEELVHSPLCRIVDAIPQTLDEIPDIAILKAIKDEHIKNCRPCN